MIINLPISPIEFSISPPEKDWFSNSKLYHFRPQNHVLLIKHEDCSIEIDLAVGTIRHNHRFQLPSDCSEKGLKIRISWKGDQEWSVWLNDIEMLTTVREINEKEPCR